MKFGAHSQMFVYDIADDVDGVFDSIAGFGLDAIEIHVADPARFPVQSVIDAKRRTGIEVVLGTALSARQSTISESASNRSAGINHLHRCVELAAAVGAEKVSGGLHSANGNFTDRGRTEEEWRRSVKALRDVAPHAEATDVLLTVEPVSRYSGYFLNTADDAIRLVEDVNSSHVRVQLDTYHMNIEESDTVAAIRRVGNYLGHFHAVENNRGVPGTGQVPWAETFQALFEIGYGDGLLIFEHFPIALRQMATRTHTWRGIASAEEVCIDGTRLLKEHLAVVARHP